MTEPVEFVDPLLPTEEFIQDYEKWHGAIKYPIGEHWHWCYDFDGLPIDEHCVEYDGCMCYADKIDSPIKKAYIDEMERRYNTYDTIWEKLKLLARRLLCRGN